MPLLPGIWAFAVPRPKADLIKEVASTYGVQGDEEMEEQALNYLNGAINDANTHLWEYNKITEAGLPFTAGRSYVEVTANAYREVNITLTDADGNTSPSLQMLPWTHFEALYPVNSAQQGTPFVFTYRNLHREGRLHFYPTPPDDYSATTDYTFNLTYYRRIPLLTEEDPLAIPREIEELLLHGAKKRMAAYVAGASHPDVATYAALEAQSLDALRAVDKRSPAESLRFRLGPSLPITVPTNGRLPYWWIY